MSPSSRSLVQLATLSNEQGCSVLHDAWYGGKNVDQPKHRIFNPAPEGPGFVLAQVPLSLVRPNEAGDLYDGTVNATRAAAYAKATIDTPVYLVLGSRAMSRGAQHANVMDSGHRVSAARMRGDASIVAVMKKDDFQSLSLLALASERQVLMDRSRLAMDCIPKIPSSSSLHP